MVDASSQGKSWIQPVADLHSKILDARPPLGVQILSISCSFWENLAKSYVGAPPLESWRPLLGEILDPPLPTLVCVCSDQFQALALDLNIVAGVDNLLSIRPFVYVLNSCRLLLIYAINIDIRLEFLMTGI